MRDTASVWERTLPHAPLISTNATHDTESLVYQVVALLALPSRAKSARRVRPWGICTSQVPTVTTERDKRMEDSTAALCYVFAQHTLSVTPSCVGDRERAISHTLARSSPLVGRPPSTMLVCAISTPAMTLWSPTVTTLRASLCLVEGGLAYGGGITVRVAPCPVRTCACA